MFLYSIRYWGTIRVIDSYKVPAFKSYCTCGKTPLQGSCIPYNVWGTISHWQLQGSHIPYKVWGTIQVTDIYKVSIFHIRYGETIRVIDSYQVPTFNIRYLGTIIVSDSYKVPAFHIRYGGTIRVTDSYKVPTFKSYHTYGGNLLQGSCIPCQVWVAWKSHHKCGVDPITRYPYSISSMGGQ